MVAAKQSNDSVVKSCSALDNQHHENTLKIAAAALSKDKAHFSKSHIVDHLSKSEGDLSDSGGDQRLHSVCSDAIVSPRPINGVPLVGASMLSPSAPASLHGSRPSSLPDVQDIPAPLVAGLVPDVHDGTQSALPVTDTSASPKLAYSKKGFMFRLFHHHEVAQLQGKSVLPPDVRSDKTGGLTPSSSSSSIASQLNAAEDATAQHVPPQVPPTPSKKHRFHLDHLFRDLLHNKSSLERNGGHHSSRGSVSVVSSDDELATASVQVLAGGDDAAPKVLGEEDGKDTESKFDVSSHASSRRGSRSDSAGRMKAAFDHVFKHLLMPPKQSTRANRALAADGELSLEQKYGACGKIIGRGAGGVVRLCAMVTPEGRACNKLFAVKEFKKTKTETEREYIKKLTSEFCISSRLHHENIIETVDLVQDENKHWCEIMEYCPHGDLYEAIKTGAMQQFEIDCYFRQLISGVEYLHSVGVAHRDLKPENLLINPDALLKITDFGVSDVFQIAWEKRPHYSRGVCGSEPYIAPEEFDGEPYDAREVDVWATGIIYYAMNFTGVPWRNATKSDPNYAYYLKYRQGRFEPFQRFPPGARTFLQKVLEPDPKLRLTIADIKKDPWFLSLETCHGIADPSNHEHTSLQAKTGKSPHR